MDFIKILQIAYPDHGWVIRDNAFESLLWTETNPTPKPTLEEALQKFDQMKPIEAMRFLREKRNELLKATDAYALPDFPHPTPEARQAWLAYRQALRDMTSSSFPTLDNNYQLDEASVQWPIKPTY